mgnify:CR=1 FL=1
MLPTKHPLARLPELSKDDLYRLGFVSLDAQSTTRKMVDQLLARSGLDVSRLKIEMELNSFEAIKNAVQSGLGAAFLPVVSIERELANQFGEADGIQISALMYAAFVLMIMTLIVNVLAQWIVRRLSLKYA